MSDRQVMRVAAWAGAAAVVASLAGGCGGYGSGPPVWVPAEQRLMVEAPTAGETVLPRDRPFNIHTRQSSQKPGPVGEAESTAEAEPNGRASASAKASKGGTAEALFQLGQMIEYHGDGPAKAAVQLSFRVQHELAAEPPDADSAANLSLTATVRDSSGQVIWKLNLDTVSSDGAQGRTERREVREFAFAVEPGKAYQIVLQGQVNVTPSEQAAASAVLRVDDLQMRIGVEPAATTQAGR